MAQSRLTLTILVALLLIHAAGVASAQVYAPPNGPRARVIILNDTAGDPDGLISTAHALMSPSAEIRAFVGTRGGTGSGDAAANGKTITELLGLNVPVFVGSIPTLNDDGSYGANPNGRLIRVYRNTQTRYFMEDFFAKLALTYPKQ